jgi:predicted SAM-dependent methyltransferase
LRRWCRHRTGEWVHFSIASRGAGLSATGFCSSSSRACAAVGLPEPTRHRPARSAPRRRAKLRAIRNEPFVGLHIGCGPFYRQGWVNTDLPGTPGIDFPLSIEGPLPLPESQFHAIYGSEVIEHVSLAHARAFFREALRILKPGGVMRLTTPDLAAVCRIYLGQTPQVTVEDFGSVWLQGEFSRDIWINSQFRAWGHQHLWSRESLGDELLQAGFVNVRLCEPQLTQSRYPELARLENRYGDDPPSWIFESAFIVEAEKRS